MATGDQNDALARLKSTLPQRWFGNPTPILDAVLTGYAWAASFVYSLYVYAKQQTRIKTATDGWLDMISADFFGTTLLRAANQSDTSFRARIIANLFRERATRAGLIKVLVDLTGRIPKIFEPMRPLDTGAWGANIWGWGAAGGYGSTLMPFQCLVNAYRPLGTGIPYVNGYGQPAGGYGSPSRAEYASISWIQQAVLDSDIYAAVDSVKPVATIPWTRINN